MTVLHDLNGPRQVARTRFDVSDLHRTVALVLSAEMALEVKAALIRDLLEVAAELGRRDEKRQTEEREREMSAAQFHFIGATLERLVSKALSSKVSDEIFGVAGIGGG